MKENFYYPELDGLRFLAFLAVFIHHSPLLAWIPGYRYFVSYGWIGVDLFLCLSAFLFVHLLRMEWERTGTINVWFFYLRRSLRIWPIYILFVFAMVLLTLSQNAFSDLSLLRTYGLLTFTDNLLTALLGYNTLLFGVGPLWTISYEEQFYAGVPWFLKYMFKRTKVKQFITLGIILAVGMGIRALFIVLKTPYTTIWVLPITHFESILFGLAIGLGAFDVVFKRVPIWATFLAGIVGLYLCAHLPNVDIVGWSLMALYPLVGLSVAFLVYSTLKAHNSKAIMWLKWRPITFLGKISYGLYLFHSFILTETRIWVAQNFVGKSLEKQNYLIFGIALAVTMVIASLSYIYIEKPFVKLKSRFTIVQSRPA